MSNNLKEAMTTLTDLKKLAEAATPGPWRKACHGVVIADKGTGNTDDDYIVLWDDTPKSIVGDATYIAAANPAAVLKMIELIEIQHEALSVEARLNGATYDTVQAIAAFESFERGEK